MWPGLSILGIVMIVIGAVWFLQGIRVLPGSMMTGSSFWAGTGALMGTLGIALLIWTRWRLRKRQNMNS